MTNDIVKPMSPFQARYVKNSSKFLIVGGAAGCLPADTEFLSETGWKNISEWAGEKVAQVSLDEKDKTFARLQFVKPKDFVNLPCEEMFQLKSTRFSMTCSDEHNVVYWNDNTEKYKTLDFDGVLERHINSKTKGWTGKIKSAFSDVSGTSGIGLSEGDLRLQVAVMADGHFVPEGANNYCIIRISKQRKIDRFLELADKFGWKYEDQGWRELDRYRSGGIQTFIVWPKLRQKRYEGIFWQATTEELSIIADEVGHWDGTIVENKSSKTVRYFSKYQQDADFIQYAFSSTNRIATIVFDSREGKPNYTVNAQTAQFRSFANKDGKCPIEVVKTPDGRKYCFETETGYFLVRQDGNIFVTGNSSKSYVGLMRFLRWVHDPNYRGFCIRKNSTAIMKAGGLFEQAKRLYNKAFPPINGKPQIQAKLKEQKLVFPSGASISFSHYENDSAGDLYQGLEMSSVFYDEGTHAEEHHLWWLFSRLRTEADMGVDPETGQKVEPCMWVSCNPDPDSFLFNYVKFWLYPEGHEKYGLPDPEKNGLIRYLLRIDGELVWGDTYEELYEKYKKPELPDDHYDQVKPISFCVLLGTLLDNPVLMKTNPGYKASLEALPDVERRRLLLGDWTAREAGSTYFQRSWCKEALEEPPASEIVRTVRAYDFAGTLKTSTNPSPDYTVAVKVSKLKSGDYFVHEMVRTRILPGQWEGFILDNARRDGFNCEIVIPLDPGAAAKLATGLLTRAISECGYRARTLRASGSKLDRFRPVSSLAMNGHITFLKGCGVDLENGITSDNNFVYKELEAFTGKRKGGESGHEDLVDGLSDAIAILASRVNIPNMSSALSSISLQNKTPFDGVVSG